MPANGGVPLVLLDSMDAERGPRSFRFQGLVRTLVATRTDQVLEVLGEAEAATAAGLHAVGFVAYEAAPAFDPALTVLSPAEGLPLAWFALFEERTEHEPESEAGGGFELGDWSPDIPEQAYRDGFQRIRDLLAAGDTYQVNYTFRLRAPFAGQPLALYHQLCRAQRSAFCAYLDIGSHAIVSASPELFFAWQAGELTLRPMKGTRRRGRWPEEDDALAAELVASPKERAENLMIVDLLRNDAGRVAIPGTIRVERMFEVERYETVLQMTSTIRARTPPETTVVDLFRALFPCGSVTGAPKVRTMEIISELETSPRGAYCGAIGFLSPGEAMFSVGIRTVVVDRAAGTAELGVGSGVTWDAVPGDEYRECLEKAAFARPSIPDFELLETLVYQPGTGFWLLGGHLDRMAESARRFGFHFDRGAAVETAHHAVERTHRLPLQVRLTLRRDGLLQATAREQVPAPRVAAVQLAAAPVDSQDPLLYHKTTRRDGYDTRRAEHPGADDVVLVNERGEVTETTIANLVARLDGALWTPPIASGLLPGVLRGDLLRRGEIAERVLTPADLARAESIWLISSVRGWRRAQLRPARPLV